MDTRTSGYVAGNRAIRTRGAGIAQWLEHRTRDWKVAGSNPCWNGGRIFFSRVDFLCWLLFRYPFHPRVTTVARKKSRSFCQKCRWQVTAKHAYTLRIEPCFGIGHNLSLMCQMTSEDIKHQLNNNNNNKNKHNSGVGIREVIQILVLFTTWNCHRENFTIFHTIYLVLCVKTFLS